MTAVNGAECENPRSMQAAWDALERNDFRFAERAAREALARSPADAEALYLLGSTLLFEGRFPEARAPLEAAAARLSRRGVRYRLGHCYLALGDPAQAERVLRAEAEQHPESANAHNTLGVALVNQAKHAEALAAFRASLALEAAHAEANANAANLLFRLDRPQEALPFAAQALQANPELAEAHLNHGLILHALKRYEEAVASLGRAYRIAPDTPYALSSLIWSALHCCDWRTLGAHLARAARAGARSTRPGGAVHSGRRLRFARGTNAMRGAARARVASRTTATRTRQTAGRWAHPARLSLGRFSRACHRVPRGAAVRAARPSALRADRGVVRT